MNQLTGFQLLIATFDEENTAATAVNRLLAEFRDDRAALPAAAYVGKDAAGQLTIRETADLGGKQGAAAGALAGGLVGLLSRKRGIFGSAALGALLGGVAAHKLDTGIPDPRLETIGAALEAASGAAVAIVGDVAYDRATALLGGLGGQLTAEPFARETDFMKQLQAGDLAGAANTLANQAEGALAGATGVAVQKAEALAGMAREKAADLDNEPLTLTEDEEIEMTIGPAAATTMTDSTGTMAPNVSAPPGASKPVPEQPPAQLAKDDSHPPSDAGGLARNDIDPAGAGLANLRPPV